jgi:hypothetical protein
MKKLFYLAALTVLLFTCKDQHEIEQHHSMLNERVGAQIPLETAKRWKDRFDKQYNSASIRQKSDDPISSSYLYDYLNDIEFKLGVGLHYGLDINNEIHYLVIKYNHETRWAENVFDAATTSVISKSAAHELCDRYKAANPHGPWSHFFGSDLIIGILAKEHFNSFQLFPSINDQNEKQLLLYVWLTEDISNGRNVQELLEVYDKTNICPVSCPSEY